MLDAPTALAACCGFDLCHKYILYLYLLEATSISTFAIELECTLTFSFPQKWYAMQMFPPLMFVVLAVGVLLSHIVPALYKKTWCHRSDQLWTGADWKAAWSAATDAVVGGLFTLLYYSYFMVVRRALELFACRAYDGKLTLESDPPPPPTCWQGVHLSLVPYAALSLLIYGLGIPVAFGYVVWGHKDAIRRDQEAWLLGRIDVDNRVRRRYSKLYQDYKPAYPYWRLVLITRKLCLVIVTVLASHNPMFQASISIGVLSVGYGLHAKHQPFISPSAQEEVAMSRLVTPPSSRVKVRRQEVGVKAMTKLVDFNVLETVLLCSCVSIILGGMIFQSSQFEVGSAMYILLTIAVLAIMIGSILLFCYMLYAEMKRTCSSRPAAKKSERSPILNPILVSRTARLQTMSKK